MQASETPSLKKTFEESAVKAMKFESHIVILKEYTHIECKHIVWYVVQVTDILKECVDQNHCSMPSVVLHR